MQAFLSNHVANKASFRQGNSLLVTACKTFEVEQIRSLQVCYINMKDANSFNDMKSASTLLGATLILFKLQSLNRDNQQDWKIYTFFSLGQS